ncbi:MAG: helix-turn-helix domain-containing protein [Pseudomonadota bacterium]
MSSTYSQLSLEERRLLDQLHHKQIPVAEISRILGRHRSTVYRELKRNKFVDQEMPELNGYYCLTAHDKAAGRRVRHIKLVQHAELREAVIDRLKVGWSPEQIAGRLRYED